MGVEEKIRKKEDEERERRGVRCGSLKLIRP
jgi:hypothetical protein